MYNLLKWCLAIVGGMGLFIVAAGLSTAFMAIMVSIFLMLSPFVCIVAVKQFIDGVW